MNNTGENLGKGEQPSNEKKERLPLEQISRISQEVCEGYEPETLPKLEEISWAFPVEGRERAYYYKDGSMARVPNTQEGNAMYQLMMLKNFDNVLKFLAQGRLSMSTIPHHILPVGDAEDMAYLHGVYWRMLPEETKKERFPTNLSRNQGFFWENMPEKLVRTVLKAEGIGRGNKVDDWGMRISDENTSVYSDPEMTKQYLTNLRQASEMGRRFMNSILQFVEEKKYYPQLIIDSKIEEWAVDTIFQMAYFHEGKKPILVEGKVVVNNGQKLDLLVGDIGQEKVILWKSIAVDLLKNFSSKEMLWKFVPPEEQKL